MFGSFHSVIFWSGLYLFLYQQQLDCFITAMEEMMQVFL